MVYAILAAIIMQVAADRLRSKRAARLGAMSLADLSMESFFENQSGRYNNMYSREMARRGALR